MGNGCSCTGKIDVDFADKIKGSAEFGMEIPRKTMDEPKTDTAQKDKESE